MAVVFECFQALGLRCLYFCWTLTIVEALRVSKYCVMLASNSDIFFSLSFRFFVGPSAFIYVLQPESGLVTLCVSQSCKASHTPGVRRCSFHHYRKVERCSDNVYVAIYGSGVGPAQYAVLLHHC